MNAIEEHKKIYTVVIQHYLNEVRPKFYQTRLVRIWNSVLLFFFLGRPSVISLIFLLCFGWPHLPIKT